MLLRVNVFCNLLTVFRTVVYCIQKICSKFYVAAFDSSVIATPFLHCTITTVID